MHQRLPIATARVKGNTSQNLVNIINKSNKITIKNRYYNYEFWK